MTLAVGERKEGRSLWKSKTFLLGGGNTNRRNGGSLDLVLGIDDTIHSSVSCLKYGRFQIWRTGFCIDRKFLDLPHSFHMEPRLTCQFWWGIDLIPRWTCELGYLNRVKTRWHGVDFLSAKPVVAYIDIGTYLRRLDGVGC